MVLFNYSTKELTAKIVYYGPGLCGKTTNLQYIFDNLPPNIHKGKMLSLATKTDRTLFFDFLPIDLGTIRGMRTRLQLYTVPGQVFYNTTRKLVLKGADGVVFVADSQKKMLDANVESFRNLEQNLEEHGMRLSEMPHVVQFNKRDLPDILGCEDLNAAVNRYNAPIYEAVATTGIGVQDTLKAVTRLVLNSLKEKYGDARRKPAMEPAVSVAAARPARAAAPAPEPKRAAEAEPILEIAEEVPPEPVLEDVPAIETPSREVPAVAAPAVELAFGEPDPIAPVAISIAPPAGPPLETEEEPVLSLEEPAEMESVVAEVVEEEPSPLAVEEPVEEAAPVIEVLPSIPAPVEIPIVEEAAETISEEVPEIAPIPEEEIEEGVVAAAPALEEPPAPLPVAAEGPFEVEVTSVEPSAPVTAEPVSISVESSSVASFETRAVALAGSGGASGESSQEAAFPFVVSVDGRTLRLRITVTVRIEKP